MTKGEVCHFEEVSDPELRELAVRIAAIELYAPPVVWMARSQRRVVEAYRRWNDSRDPASVGGHFYWVA